MAVFWGICERKIPLHSKRLIHLDGCNMCKEILNLEKNDLRCLGIEFENEIFENYKLCILVDYVRFELLHIKVERYIEVDEYSKSLRNKKRVKLIGKKWKKNTIPGGFKVFIVFFILTSNFLC